MRVADVRATFAGSIPGYYDTLGPAWFDAFAEDLARRLPAPPPGDVLEIACGTGIQTRRLRQRLAPELRVVATDLSKPMVDYARGKLADTRGIEWREADALKLPFDDGAFGAAVCSFGFMFVPDKPAAFKEARRVLKEGGTLLFNVWDSLEENRHAAINAAVVEGLAPGDPELRFGTPYEMCDPALLRSLLAGARFREVRIEKARIELGRVSAKSMAIGHLRGTPRSILIEKKGFALEQVIEKLAAALAEAGGADPYRGTAQAVVVEARAI
jgi:SAM-dependent methyltransferase